jgi:hypothetical protein
LGYGGYAALVPLFHSSSERVAISRARGSS